MRLWLVACHGAGEGRMGEKEAVRALLGNTRHAEFAVYCFADNFCACISPHPSGILGARWTGSAGSSWTIGLGTCNVGSIQPMT